MWGAHRRPSECWAVHACPALGAHCVLGLPRLGPEPSAPLPQGRERHMPRDSRATCGAWSWDWLCRGEILGSAEYRGHLDLSGRWAKPPGASRHRGTPHRGRDTRQRSCRWAVIVDRGGHPLSMCRASYMSLLSPPAALQTLWPACKVDERRRAGQVAEGQAPRQRGVRTERRGCFEARAWPGQHSGVLTRITGEPAGVGWRTAGAGAGAREETAVVVQMGVV